MTTDIPAPTPADLAVDLLASYEGWQLDEPPYGLLATAIRRAAASERRVAELEVERDRLKAVCADIIGERNAARADAAALREALQHWYQWCQRDLGNEGADPLQTIMADGQCDICCAVGGHHDDCEVLLTVNALASPGPGAALLARLQLLEDVVKAAKSAVANRTYVADLAVALRKLDAKEQSP